jgi:TonB family protein
VWIARDNNLVLRDIWDYELPFGNNVVKTRQTISYSAIEWSDLVAEDVFLFTPPEGSKAVRAFTPPPTTLNHPGLGVGGGIGSGRPDGLGRGAGTNGTSGTRPGVYHVGNGVTAPSVLSKTEPVYTEEVRAAKLQGDVLLYLEVDPSGKPTNIKVIRSLGLGLDLKAIEAVGTWVFTPGTKDGKAVTVAAQIVVNFRLL